MSPSGAHTDAALNTDAAMRAAVRTMLEPGSMAIIGASDKSRWSINVFDNLRDGGYAGKVHLINPRGAIAHGQQCATSCAAVGERIDVGLIMTPGTAVADAIADLAAAGARSAVIITAGFSETGAQGQALQRHRGKFCTKRLYTGRNLAPVPSLCQPEWRFDRAVEAVFPRFPCPVRQRHAQIGLHGGASRLRIPTQPIGGGAGPVAGLRRPVNRVSAEVLHPCLIPLFRSKSLS